jgi:hypothetical protein
LKELNDIVASSSRLVAQALDIVVVVVELGGRVSCCSGLERDLDVVGPEDVQKGVVAEGAVVIQGFVHDVPGVALAGPVLRFCGYVVDECGSEVLFRPGVVVD